MYKLFKSFIFTVGILAVSHSAFAAKDEIYTSLFSKVGAGGYDVVAYFTESKPVKGSDDFSTQYKKAEWHFASAANLQAFQANPEKYAPQYGGYCAYAVALNSTASGDPLQWSVVDKKLYLNYDADVQIRWNADRDNFIVKSEKNWPSVLN